MRLLPLFTLLAAAFALDTCNNPLVKIIETAFNASDPFDLAHKVLSSIQTACAAGNPLCPRINYRGCKNQSVDDIHCELLDIFSASEDIGGDAVCDVGCDDWPCKAACQGIDVGICFGADWILCKAGCLGISSCVHKCEAAIVDPCKQKLITDCSDKCEAAFADCKIKCKKELSLDVSGNFERLHRLLSSMRVDRLDLACEGSGILNPLFINATIAIGLGDVALDLQVKLEDAGITSTNALGLHAITLDLEVPFQAELLCNRHTQMMNFTIGAPSLMGFDLDVDLKLDDWISTLVTVFCLGLPFCKDAIKDGLSSTLKKVLVGEVPGFAATAVGEVLRELARQATCPSSASGVLALQ